MIEQQQLTAIPFVSQEKLYPQSVDEFLSSLGHLVDLNVEKGMRLDFILENGLRNGKISPVLKLAKPEDAGEVANICKEVYQGTYPYKEMEDEKAVRQMIKDPKHRILLFKVGSNENAGCFRCMLDFENKKGYMGGFMVRKEYQGVVDVVKTIVGSYLWMWNEFKNDILVWHCENRTAHAVSQYITAVCGIHTVAILPNKDIFFNEIESDVLGIIYSNKVLRTLRSAEIPTLVPEALGCFLYSDELFGLGPFTISNPNFILDPIVVSQLAHKLTTIVDDLGFGYEKITFLIADSDSFFSFLYTKQVQNFEKVEYKVNNFEELQVFLGEFKKIATELSIRYCEVFVSAYKPEHQKLFLHHGFAPRGYIPCWNYDKLSNVFKDYIVFNYYEGQIKDIKLRSEGFKLLELLGINGQIT